MIFKGLETVRTDWTPLAQEFQQTLYKMIFMIKTLTSTFVIIPSEPLWVNLTIYLFIANAYAVIWMSIKRIFLLK